jgi:hypothetical protein
MQTIVICIPAIVSAKFLVASARQRFAAFQTTIGPGSTILLLHSLKIYQCNLEKLNRNLERETKIFKILQINIRGYPFTNENKYLITEYAGLCFRTLPQQNF